MAEIKVKGPGNTEAVLTQEQFLLVESIILLMMNQEIKVATAQARIIKTLKDAGKPLVFQPPQVSP